MRMPSINELKIDATTAELIKDIQEAARKVNELRPLSKDVVEQVRRDILGERVYASNAIEGNTCDLRETIAILRAGHVSIEPRRRREADEVLNLGKAIEQMQGYAVPDSHDIKKFLDIHHTLLAGINDDWAGRFRDSQVMVRGAKHQPPDSNEIADLMEVLFEELRNRDDKIAPTAAAAWAHWAIARIHPFFDGNGRIARLWQDLLLFHHGLTCAIIRPEDRRDYLFALAQADENDFNPFIQLVTRRTIYPSLREIVVNGDSLTRKRWNGDQECQDDEIGATRIAQEFIQEVLLFRLPHITPA